MSEAVVLSCSKDVVTTLPGRSRSGGKTPTRSTGTSLPLERGLFPAGRDETGPEVRVFAPNSPLGAPRRPSSDTEDPWRRKTLLDLHQLYEPDRHVVAGPRRHCLLTLDPTTCVPVGCRDAGLPTSIPRAPLPRMTSNLPLRRPETGPQTTDTREERQETRTGTETGVHRRRRHRDIGEEKNTPVDSNSRVGSGPTNVDFYE